MNDDAANRSPDAQSAWAMFAGLRVVSFYTLLSRILGLVRDIGMATLFGNGPVFDAFTLAFKVPNLARRLFGEGALTAAFLPTFVRELHESGKTSAFQLATAMFATVAVVLVSLVLVGETALGIVTRFGQLSESNRLLAGLTAVMLPYLLFVCLNAQLSAVLHAQGHFSRPAFLPVLLNCVWIAAIVFVAPRYASPSAQAYAIAASILVGGVVQMISLAGPLKKVGFRWQADWARQKSKVADVSRAMLPIVVGLSVAQLNTLCDSLMAWGFSDAGAFFSDSLATAGLPELNSGTVSALYLGQRMYQFPLGVFAIALGTVLFPQLARHVEQGRLDRMRSDLALGLRLVMIVGLPASAGLILLADPLSTALFQYKAFDADDARQTAAMITAYGAGVWAFSSLLILHRAFYAIGDRLTPVRIGTIAIVLNLTLNVALIWVLGGFGLALATSLTAIVQTAVTVWLLQYKTGSLNWRELGSTAARSLIATAAMSIVCAVAIRLMPTGDALLIRLLRIGGPFASSVATYFVAAYLLKLDDLWTLFRRKPADHHGSHTNAEDDQP